MRCEDGRTVRAPGARVAGTGATMEIVGADIESRDGAA
jgi:hypothetical protein